LAALLLAKFGQTYAGDFQVKVPLTDQTGYLFYPVKAGNSFQFKVEVKNQLQKGRYTISIDKNSMGEVKSWINIDNNNQVIAPGQTVTYILTVNVPSNASDIDYSLPLSFNAYDSLNNNHPFSYWTQTIIVDNSVPQTPTFSTVQYSKKIYVSGWSSFDNRSRAYTLKDPSSGIEGIKTYNIVLANPDGSKISKEFKASESNYYTFDNLISNTNYTVSVTAYDLAGNANTKQITAKTAPAAPTLSYSKTSYCYVILTWNAPAGAVKYKVYNATNTPPVLLTTTTATSYTVTGLQAGSSLKFYVVALNSSDSQSDASNNLNIATLTVPTPIISGARAVCTSGATFTVSNLPSECSLSWDKGSYLSLVSSSGTSATFKAIGTGSSFIKATYNSGCGIAANNYTVDAGTPKPGPITIQFDAPPNRFTASIDPLVSATSYKWYLDGVLKYNSLMDVVIFQRQIGNCGHRYDVDVYMVNSCGVSAFSHAETYEPPCLKSFSVYPNPANSEITIAQNESLVTSMSSERTTENLIKSVKIVDNFGMTYIDNKFDNGVATIHIDISILKPGSYIIIINSELNMESYPLIKN
jgi:hypothetical protein